ncbi:MAG: response regulator [Bacteroidales bacterium]|nr:response regulator [Bacteroidales bacterium]
MKKKIAILCVDDENVLLDSLLEQLQRNFGQDTIYEAAENAEEGMQVLEELIEDGLEVVLVVSDWLMPGMKGDQFLIDIYKKYPHVIKIMLTGQATQEAVENAKKNANLHDYIEKPWMESKLVESIRRGLNEINHNKE